MAEPSFGDALTAPFWDAAATGVLQVQRCDTCGVHQFYPRPFCLRCDGPVRWVVARGTGTVYSKTTIRVALISAFEPPYVVALVELDEGPRLLTTLTAPTIGIGERVRVVWQDRGEGPPMPVFGPEAD